MFLNRCAITLTPKAPYIAWANSLDSEGGRYEDGPDDEGEPVFLGPEVEQVDDARAFVLANFDFFFETYLEMWWLDAADRPESRTAEMFQEWFDVTISSMVEDVMDEPLILE